MANTMISSSENRAWCVVFSLEAAAIILGNLLIIVVFSISRSLHRKTYYLLISLAVADLLVGAVAVPMYVNLIGGAVSQFWELHTHIAYAQRSMEIFTSFASIFFLAAIALERCYAVTYPLSYAYTKSLTYFCVIGFVWFFSALLGVLSLLREAHIDAVNQDGIFIALVVFITLTLVLVFVAYLTTFCVVRVRLGSSRKLDESTALEVKLAFTLFLLSIIFFVTWLPFTVINIVFHSDRETTLSCGQGNWVCIYHVIYFTKFLHYFNSLVNPIIYACGISEFRRGAKRILCCCCYGSNEPAPIREVTGIDNPAVSMNSIATSVPSMYV